MELAIPEVRRILKENGIPDHYYNLDGFGNTDQKFCLERAGDKWRVYFSERGKVFEEKYFDTLSEACLDVLDSFHIKEFKVPVILGRIIRLDIAGRKRFVPIKKDDFMLTKLRGIRNFSNMKEAENALLSGNPHPVLPELCTASGKEEALSIIRTENSRREFVTALWQKSVIGYYLLLEEEGRISHDNAMGLCAIWCDGYSFAGEDELLDWEASGRPDELFPMKPRAMEMYKRMAKAQVRALRKFFGTV